MNGVTTGFAYDGLNVVQEQVGVSAAANLITGRGLDEIFARLTDTAAEYVASDALGSALALLDATGAVSTQYTYTPFGAWTASGAGSTNAFGFTGRETDGTGLVFYRARYYHPAFQRFCVGRSARVRRWRRQPV